VCAAATQQMEINAQFYAVMQAVANQVEKSKQRFVLSFPSTPFDLWEKKKKKEKKKHLTASSAHYLHPSIATIKARE
jgi:hypothetical protein